jgi:hypothetical protein
LMSWRAILISGGDKRLTDASTCTRVEGRCATCSWEMVVIKEHQEFRGKR